MKDFLWRWFGGWVEDYRQRLEDKQIADRLEFGGTLWPLLNNNDEIKGHIYKLGAYLQSGTLSAYHRNVITTLLREWDYKIARQNEAHGAAVRQFWAEKNMPRNSGILFYG